MNTLILGVVSVRVLIEITGCIVLLVIGLTVITDRLLDYVERKIYR